MRGKNRKSIASIGMLPQFTTMNVIEGQAGLMSYSSLIFYSLTLDNILNIIVLLILAGISIMMLTGENGILTRAQEAKNRSEEAEKGEQETLGDMEDILNEYITGITVEQVTDSNPGVLEGSGAESDPYVINSIEDLVFFAHDVTNGNKYEGEYVSLGLSLDFNSTKSYVDAYRTDYGIYGYEGELKTLLTSGTGFNIIGSVEQDTNNFYGIFDGNDYTIYNLFINRYANSGLSPKFYGLFSENYGTIKNLNVMGKIEITEYKKNVIVGLVAGINWSTGIIEGCASYGTIRTIEEEYEDETPYYIATGGICGQQNAGSIKNCNNNATIIAEGETTYTGGIVGSNNGGEVLRSYNVGSISAYGDNELMIRVGGIVGNSVGTVENCFNVGEIVGLRMVGGICGAIDVRNFMVTNCIYNNPALPGIGGEANNSEFTDETINDSTLTIQKILEILK